MPGVLRVAAIVAVLVAVTVVVVVAVRPGQPVIAPPTFAPATPGEAVLVGAGDIADCGLETDDETADLLDTIDGIVFTTGDNAYPNGTSEEFAECYGPTWGRHLHRTRPTPGNHDYRTASAAGYLGYFGTSARPEGTTWYSFDAGEWHVVMLDSNCEKVDCTEDSAQVSWLRDDLARDDARCEAAVFHHPRFSSGFHGNDNDVAAFWDVLYDERVELVINGHDHNYERFAPQDPEERADPERGIRQIVVGTGGGALRDFEDVRPNSEVRESSTHGVLKLTLRPDTYEWEFVPIEGQTFTDAGTGTCR